MKFHTILLLFVVFSIEMMGQDVKVLNVITKEPISGVAVFDENKAKVFYTNMRGIVNIDEFASNEILFFTHLSHVSKSIKKSELSKSNRLYLDSNTQGLNEIVISASKFEQVKTDIPQKILNINSDKIAFVNAQTSADLLQSSGLVFVQKSQLGGGSPMIRGFSTNRLLITVDGIRMNNAIFRGGNVHNVIAIDPLTIKNTEVTLGAGSVIYGSDAIGGVMSFYTKQPKFSETDSLYVKTNSLARYASANNEKTGHIDVNLGYSKWAFLTSLSYSNFNDLRMGTYGPDDYLRTEFVSSNNLEDVIITNSNPKIQKFSGYNQLYAMQKIAYKPYKNLSFDLGVHYSQSSNIPRYDRLVRYNDTNELRYAEWDYGPQKWLMTNFQVTKLSSRSNLYDKIKATFGFQNFQESRINRIYQANNRTIREEGLNAYSFNLDLEKKLSDKTRFSYGLEFVYNSVKSKGIIENITNNASVSTVSRYPNGSNWSSKAVYSNIKYKPNTQFVFQSGLRFNHIESKADFSDNNQFLNLPFAGSKNKSGAFTGTMGISWSANDVMQWKLNLASAFRAPNIDDIGKVFDSEPGSVVVPNENLKPEYAYGGELGLKLNFDEKVVLDLSTYYTYLDNALVRRDFKLNGETRILYDGVLSDVQAIQNASKAWIYGFEVGLKIKLIEKLQLTSQYSVTGGTEENNDIEVPIRHVAPTFGNTHLTWKGKKITIDAFLDYNGELSFNQLAPSEREKFFIYALNDNGQPFAPSWYTLNLRSQYKISPKTTFSASIENITDQRYRPYSSGISGAGRNLILSLNYSF